MGRKSKRNAILEAAEAMIRDRRFHEVTLDEVAHAAHVGKGTIYRYFKDKDDLFFQLATHGHEELCEAIAASAATKNQASFEDHLAAMCRSISDFFLGRHALFRLIGEHEGRFKALRLTRREALSKHRARLRAAVAKVLALGIPGGHMRTDIPPETQAQFLLGLMRARDLAFGEEAADRPPIDMVIDIFLHGVQAPHLQGV